MRLTKYELESIHKVFKEVFDNRKIYLFGSRVDNALKGGDIDLYIQTTDNKDVFQKKYNF